MVQGHIGNLFRQQWNVHYLCLPDLACCCHCVRISCRKNHLFGRATDLKKWHSFFFFCLVSFIQLRLLFPSQAERGPEGADRGKAHLNGVRFNSNWVFFTNNDCLKVGIQFQKFLKIPKFGLTEGVIFNSENGKLSCWQKWGNRQISEMSGENSKKIFCIASCGLLPTLKKKIWVPHPPRPTGHRCKVGKVGSRFW